MQKIFDVNNKEDMDLLWSILPEEIVKIAFDGRYWDDKYNKFKRKDESDFTAGRLFNIAWNDKTEITRPVNYEDMIGYVCKFSSCPIRIGGCFIGVLDAIDKDSPSKFHMEGGGWFEYCEPAKKSELKFYGD